MRVLTLLIALIFLAPVYGQNANPYQSSVRTKGGDTYVGTIIRYEPGKMISLRDRSGTVITVQAEQVKRISFRLTEAEATALRTTYDTLPPGSWYHQIGAGVNFGQIGRPDQSQDAESVVGYDLSWLLVRRIGQHFSVGAGVNYSLYHQERKERSLGLVGQFRALANKRPNTFFAQLEGGYAFVLGSKDLPLRDRSGGFLVHPAVGWMSRATKSSPNFSVDLGYRFLRQERVYESWQGIANNTYDYRRLVFRLTVGI